MRLAAIIAICGLLLAVLSPVALSVTFPSGIPAEMTLTLDVCHADAPFVSVSGMAPCLIEFGYEHPPVRAAFEILPAEGECFRSLHVSPLFRPPIFA